MAGWLDVSEQAGTEGQFVLCKLGTQSSNTSTNVLFSLKIGDNFSWMPHYLGESVGKSSLFASSPHALTTVSHVEELLKKVDSSKACIGNPDEKFAVLAASRNGVFTNATGNIQ